MKKVLITALLGISLFSLAVMGFETVNTYSDGMFSDVDESAWYAKYDEAAGTLTISGVELFYETYENQYGNGYG